MLSASMAKVTAKTAANTFGTIPSASSSIRDFIKSSAAIAAPEMEIREQSWEAKASAYSAEILEKGDHLTSSVFCEDSEPALPQFIV